jgi:hypothetical protein
MRSTGNGAERVIRSCGHDPVDSYKGSLPNREAQSIQDPLHKKLAW